MEDKSYDKGGLMPGPNTPSEPKTLSGALLDIAQLKLGLAEAQRQLKEELDTIAKLSTDYATLERQHQSVVAELNATVKELEQLKETYRSVDLEQEKNRKAEVVALNSLAAERKENNNLRQLLMQSQLNYARLCGYIDGMQDAKPRRMVEADDKTGLDRIKDNSWCPGEAFRHSDGSKAWYQK